MEKIIISNFLNLKHVELDLSKINIIIGPQAQGKSIVAKLIFFFKKFLVNYKDSIINKDNKNILDKQIIENFKAIFPEYTWNNQDFIISYNFSEYQINLSSHKLSNGRRKLVLKYSNQLSELRRKLIKKYNVNDALIDDRPKNDYIFLIENNFGFHHINKHVNKLLFAHLIKLENPIYITAGRSFFANLQRNIFSFLSGNVPIDYFLKEFGSTYEKVKNAYAIDINKIFEIKQYQNVKEIIGKIIVGDYAYEKSQDWIYSKDGRRINLSNASSGQQEALPMALILAVLPFMSSNCIFIIEEPEAHLFPTSQKHIIELISLVFNLTEQRHSFLITTHSPYILTAFNNLIQGSNSLKALEQRRKNESDRQKLLDLIPENQMLDIKDIGAYTLENGELTNIINAENNLIDTNIIDDVSNEFSETYDKLLDLEYGE